MEIYSYFNFGSLFFSEGKMMGMANGCIIWFMIKFSGVKSIDI